MIEKAVCFFAKDLSTKILQFNGTYYKHVGNDEHYPGLIIGGHESAFLSHLLIVFVFKLIEPKLFEDNFLLNKIHRDDGMLINKEKCDVQKFTTWIKSFQREYMRSSF